MKRIVLLILLFPHILLHAQEERSVSILFNLADTTYRVLEVTTVDEDTVSLRFLPETWLGDSAFQQFLYRQAVDYEQRAEEFRQLRQEALDLQGYYSAQIDTLFGAGTYQTLRRRDLENELLGAWTLHDRKPGLKTKRFRVLVQRDSLGTLTLMTRDSSRTATIAALDGNSFELQGWIPAALTFQRRGDRAFAALRNNRRFILKR